MTKTTKEIMRENKQYTHSYTYKGMNDLWYSQSDFDQLRKELKDDVMIVNERICMICDKKTLVYHQIEKIIYCRKCFIDYKFNKFSQSKEE